ncbi:MAG TPA: PQQ-dependent dehydrogenase, methanol/ethanol family [Vicinamibacterales bacterium]|nr:PQQ-dependent dehydrogenase, methanol/ethanol family [Vicinamibacterales bacterium]
MSVLRASLRVFMVAACVAFAAAQELPPPKNYAPVTAQRLLKPGDGEWLMIRRTYDGWGYSPLDKINTSNVSRLKPVWMIETGEARVHEAAPIVNGGVMFVTTPNNQVIALDATSGAIRWRYKRPRIPGALVPHDTNRGVALYGNNVYFAAGEAIVVALDARTGKEVWTSTVADNKAAYYISLAPLIANGKVMVGTSGGEYGVRGFVAALDPETGKELWRTYTIPGPGEPGHETWPAGDAWKHGGAPIWVTGNYDPATNLAYWGTGNGGPWMGDVRPGDNLYTTSVIALDVTTGALKGHFQYHQNDAWDWDEVSPPILVDYKRNGRTVKGLIDVARDGYLWFLERPSTPVGTNSAITFVEGKPYVYQNVFKSLDQKTGRPEVDLAHKPATGVKASYCPDAHGGKNWPPIAFSPKTRMIYIPATNNLCGETIGVPVTYEPGRNFGGVSGFGSSKAPGADHFGEVQAWNVDTGKLVWTHNYAASPNWGSMLATAGGLVISGGTSDRKIHAFDAATGTLLWESEPLNSGALAPPTTFLIDGRQYLAVESGWGGDVQGATAAVNRFIPGEHAPVPTGGAVYVFALQ